MTDGHETVGGLGDTPHPPALAEPASESDADPLIAVFKKDVDRTLLVDNLRRTFDQRARRMKEFIRARETLSGMRKTFEERRRLEAAGEIPSSG